MIGVWRIGYGRRMFRRCRRMVGLGLAAVTLVCLAAVAGTASVHPISEDYLSLWESFRLMFATLLVPDDVMAVACPDFERKFPVTSSQPVAHVEIPQHPFMSANAGNSMHCDSYISDTYAVSGPMGVEPAIVSRTQGFGGYGTLTFDRNGRIVAVYSNGRRFQLELMDPYTLEELASYDLPPRPWYWLLQGIMPWEYIGAGMYFYLDQRDRAIVPTTENTIEVIQVSPSGEGFVCLRSYDLSDHVVRMPWPQRDSVAWVLPDWSGAYYWYATTAGMIGTVAVDSGEVHTLRLDGEIIENSFAVAEDGAYILSDRAMYRLNLGHDGAILVDWRTAYDRGPAKKPGHITRGSGTSVSLMGDVEGLVALTDNAEPRIHLQLLRRSDGTLACEIPLFEEGRSGTDVSVACFEHADASGWGTGVYSILVENNWGHHTFPRSRPEPGLTRIDVVRGDDGTYSCRDIWSSEEKSIGVFKLSLGNGLVYMYWRSETCPATQWILTAIDFETGETTYRQRMGRGLGFNNWAGALFLHPDGGIAYSTTLFGLVMIQDRPPE